MPKRSEAEAKRYIALEDGFSDCRTCHGYGMMVRETFAGNGTNKSALFCWTCVERAMNGENK